MKLNTAPANAVEMNGITSTSQFTIRASAKAFGILSSGLYANKIRAIVRELSTNALDSHIAANCADKPFDVNLPNMMAPWFSVRDYGVGLSHDEVVNIYTSYFTSTKAESDDFVGALGLGSKSPFSYTDNFTVTAIKDGRMGLYTAYIDETGVPAIALMSESETDEPNGVEVKFSVSDRNDFRKFDNEASHVYRFFTVLPNFTGEEPNVEPYKYFKENIVPGVHVRDVGGSAAENIVVMGSIPYPIDLPAGAIDRDLSNIDSQSLVIHLPIGAVEMSASREELSYTPETIKTIKDIYQKVDAEIEKAFDEGLKDLTNQWDIHQYLIKHVHTKLFKKFAVAYATNNPSPLWAANGHYLYTSEFEIREDRCQELNIKLHYIKAGWGTPVTRSPQNFYDTSLNKQYKYHKIPVDDKLKFVQGIGHAPVARVKGFLRTRNRDRSLVLATPLDRKQPMQWDKLMEEFCNPPQSMIKDVESMPAPEKKAREAATPVWRFALTSGRHGELTSVMQPYGVLEDIKADGETTAYVKLYRAETHLNGEAFDLRGLYAGMKSSGLMKDNSISVYGVRGDNLATVEADPNWVSFDAAVQKLIDKVTEEEFVNMWLHKVDGGWLRVYNVMKKDQLDQTSLFSKVISAYSLHGLNTNIDDVIKLVTQFGSDAAKQRMKDAETMVRGMSAKYPMLRYLSHGITFQLINDYVKMIDNAKGD